MIRRTLRWLLVFVLLTAVGVGGYVYWKVSQVNTMIRERLLADLAEKAPNWEVTVDDVRFDWNRTVHAYGVTVRPRGDELELARIPEMRILFDREEYDRSEVVDVQRIHLLQPVVQVVRETDGTWNWQRLFPLGTEERSSLPEWVVDDASIRVRLKHAGGESTDLPPAGVTGRVVPSGKRRFQVVGNVAVDGTGAFDLDGELDADRKQWSFTGRARDLVSGEKLVDLATRASPETRETIARFDAQLQGWLPEEARPVVRVADASGGAGAIGTVGETRRVPRSTETSSTLGIDGRLALEFRLEQSGPDAEIEYSIRADFDGAQLDHPALPFPLHDVDGRIVWGNRRFVVEGFQARNGVTRLSAHGQLVHDEEGPGSRGSFDLKLNDVVLDERLRSRLTGRLRTVYDTLRPSGRADFSTRIVVDEEGTRTEDLVLATKGAEGSYVDFPYRYERITGGIRQEGRDLAIEVDGFAGRVPVAVRGRVRDFLGEGAATFTIRGKGIPIDQRFLQACRPAVRDVLVATRIEGNADFELRLERPAGTNTDWTTNLDATLAGAAIEFRAFPYRVTDLTGRIAFDSRTGVWRFDDLAGRHDDAKLSGSGRFTKRNDADPGRLQLRVVAREATFDRQLRLALSETLRDTWRMLDPSGTVDAAIDVDWSPGRPIVVKLPAVVLTDGTLHPEVLPLKLSDVVLRASYLDGTFTVEKFAARYGETAIRATGAFAREPNGAWRLRASDLIVDDLDANAEFRAALPKAMRPFLASLDPRGPLSLTGRLELRGNGDPGAVPTAAWELDAVLPNNSLHAGVDLESLRGTASSEGTYDGQKVRASGRIDFDTVVVMGYQFTQVKGPYSVDGRYVQLGSSKAFEENVPPITREERITGHAIDGLCVLDALVVTGDEPAYNLKASLFNGKLESYAQRYMPGARNLAGVMNGWIDLHGRGTGTEGMSGRGQLRISPAALYELPLVLKLVTAVPFAPAKRNAFDYALLEYRIADRRFLFDTIDLVGNSFSLRGRGTVGFDRSLNLDFYSQRPRNQLAIPVIGMLAGEAAKGLVAVYVRGTLERPQTEVVTAPTIDNALKSFLGPLVNPAAAMQPRRRQ